MGNEFEWSVVLKFKGTEEEFAKLSDSLNEAPVEIIIPDRELIKNLETIEARIKEGKWPPRFPGRPPYPDRILKNERILELAKGMQKIGIRYPRDIAGGIRTFHLHIGDEVVLLTHERFKTLVSEVAAELASMNVDTGVEFVEIMSKLDSIGPDSQIR